MIPVSQLLQVPDVCIDQIEIVEKLRQDQTAVQAELVLKRLCQITWTGCPRLAVISSCLLHSFILHSHPQHSVKHVKIDQERVCFIFLQKGGRW